MQLEQKIQRGVQNFLKESDDESVSNDVFCWQDLNNLSHISKSKQYALFKQWAANDLLNSDEEKPKVKVSIDQIAEAMGYISWNLQGLEGGLEDEDERIIEEARLRMKMNYCEHLLAKHGIKSEFSSDYLGEDQYRFQDFIEFMEENIEGEDFSLDSDE